MDEAQKDNAQLDKEWETLTSTVSEIMIPFYALRDLLKGEPREINTADLVPLLDMALTRAENIVNGQE